MIADDDSINIIFSESDVNNAILSMSDFFSCGPDENPYVFWKNTSVVL